MANGAGLGGSIQVVGTPDRYKVFLWSASLVNCLNYPVVKILVATKGQLWKKSSCELRSPPKICLAYVSFCRNLSS